jgi:hypothetical protein
MNLIDFMIFLLQDGSTTQADLAAAANALARRDPDAGTPRPGKNPSVCAEYLNFPANQ